MVSFYLFARAPLLRKMGANAPKLLVRVRSAETIRMKPCRTEYQRGALAAGADDV